MYASKCENVGWSSAWRGEELHSGKAQLADSAPVPCRADEGGGLDDCWFGQVRLVFSMEDGAGRTRECILVRWYDAAEFDAHDAHLSSGMRKLRWATTRVDSQERVPWYDVKLLSDVIQPVLIQSHPTKPDVFYNNRFA